MGQKGMGWPGSGEDNGRGRRTKQQLQMAHIIKAFHLPVTPTTHLAHNWQKSGSSTKLVVEFLNKAVLF